MLGTRRSLHRSHAICQLLVQSLELPPGTRADRAFRYLWKFIRCHLHQRLERSAAIERLELTSELL